MEDLIVRQHSAYSFLNGLLALIAIVALTAKTVEGQPRPGSPEDPIDCLGVPYGSAKELGCGCGKGTGCYGCDGIANSRKKFVCGVCGGSVGKCGCNPCPVPITVTLKLTGKCNSMADLSSPTKEDLTTVPDKIAKSLSKTTDCGISATASSSNINESNIKKATTITVKETKNITGCAISNAVWSWSSTGADNCIVKTGPKISQIQDSTKTSGTFTLPSEMRVSQEVAVTCSKGFIKATVDIVVDLKRPGQASSNDRDWLSAAFGSGNNDGVGVTATTPDVINLHLKQMCTNLGYQVVSRTDGQVPYTIYTEGFTTPENNNNCWIVGSGIQCKNAKENGNPPYIGSVYCNCAP